MNDVAKNIRKIRRQKGITQDALAEQLHVTRQAVSNWETGKNQPDLDMLESISQALGVELTELLYGAKRTEDYPRFQKKAVVWAAAAGVMILLLLADLLIFRPWFRVYMSTHYTGINARIINDWIVLPILCLGAGIAVPAAASLWREMRAAGRLGIVFRIAAILLLIPAVMMFLNALNWLGIFSGEATLVGRFYYYLATDPTLFRLRLALYYMPVIAGGLLYAGCLAPRQQEGQTQ